MNGQVQQQTRRNNSGSKKKIGYIGAGGGGDSAAALLLDLALNGKGDNIILGAGYEYLDYFNSIKDGNKNRATPPVFERLKYSDSKEQPFNNTTNVNKAIIKSEIDEYLNIITGKEGVVENKLFPILKLDNLKLVYKFFKPLLVKKPANNITNSNVAKIVDGEGSSFKYKSLLEETLIVNKLKDFNISQLYMFSSCSKLSEKVEKIKSCYSVLLEAIIPLKKVVILDFGGDILDFKNIEKDARDVMVFIMTLSICYDRDIPIEIQIYGAGCDSHASPETVMNRIKELKENLNVQLNQNTQTSYQNTCIKKLIDFIDQNNELLKSLNITGENRATGNFYIAYKLSQEANSNTINNKYLQKCIMARGEYNKLNEKEKVKMDNSAISEFAQCNFIKLVNKESIKKFIDNVQKDKDYINQLRKIIGGLSNIE